MLAAADLSSGSCLLLPMSLVDRIAQLPWEMPSDILLTSLVARLAQPTWGEGSLAERVGLAAVSAPLPLPLTLTSTLPLMDVPPPPLHSLLFSHMLPRLTPPGPGGAC